MANQPSLPAKSETIPLRTFLLIGGVLLCLILSMGGVGYYYYGPCGVSRVHVGILDLGDQFDSYHAVYDLASKTPRYALDEPVSQFRKVKRDMQLLPLPSCLEGARSELVLATDATIQEFLFFQQQNDFGVDMFTNEATAHLSEFLTQLELADQCAPFCQMR